MFYGLMHKEDAVVAARAVCEVIGSPATRENAVALLVETAAAETLLGELRDPTMYAAGTGLTQVDKGTFDWLKGLYANTPVAEAIQRKFDDLDYLFDLGDIDCNFSGCMNACGHHHIGNIGILGVDKNGQEWYQITLGGSQGNYTAIGKVIGPSFAQADVPAAFEKIMTLYVEQRQEGERFIETVRRIGIEPFKERVYAKSH